MMNRFAHVVITVVAAILLVAEARLLPGPPSIGPRSARAQDGWKTEFEAVCAGTDTAMTLSPEKLRERIVRCDRLKTAIEAEEESTRKVYLRRLRMCRDLYRYILDSGK